MNQSTPTADTLFSPAPPAGTAPRVLPTPDLAALSELDWDELYARLNEEGVAVTAPLLSRAQCQEIIDTFDEPGLFRSTVVMQRYQFGRGTYKYYADPATVPLVQTLRERLYPPMAWMANRWAPQLNERTFPTSLEELLAECADNGQHRSTPLLLRYGPGDYACLHQDIYGDIVLPVPLFHPRPAPGRAGAARGVLPPSAPHRPRLGGQVGRPAPWPDTLQEWVARCHEAGQSRSAQILLRYGPGDWNALHRDVFGEMLFPLQVVIGLDAPGVDFTGGGFLMTEQRPRAQSRGSSTTLLQGHGLVFTTRDRPVATKRGWANGPMRHGVSTVRSGRRHSLGLVFHDAA